jgi:hypothetical protein
MIITKEIGIWYTEIYPKFIRNLPEIYPKFTRNLLDAHPEIFIPEFIPVIYRNLPECNINDEDDVNAPLFTNSIFP